MMRIGVGVDRIVVLCYARLDHKTWTHFQKNNNSFPQVLEGH